MLGEGAEQPHGVEAGAERFQAARELAQLSWRGSATRGEAFQQQGSRGAGRVWVGGLAPGCCGG